MFLQHLRAVIDYYRLDLSIYFWRTTSGLEVDYILYGGGGLFAFEIKSRSYIERKDFKGLVAFQADYPITHCYLIYGGEFIEKHGNIQAIPIRHALFNLVDLLHDSGSR